MKEPIVWSCGYGLNSIALAVGLVEHGESYDLAMFADTGGEKPATYAYQEILAPYLTKHGLPPVMRVWKKNQDMTPAKTLEQDCLDRKALPSIAYGFKSCSDHYKLRPQEAIIKHWQPAVQAWERGETVIKLIGFDAGESHRALRVTETKQYHNRYPLIEWNWGREECLEAITRAGLPVPPKSACFFCPSSKKAEVLELARTYPALFDRAVAIEQNADITSLKGLGRNYAWKDLWAGNNLELYPDMPDMPCMCFEGES